jgi:carboxyl-terminal processing protease
MRLLTQIMKSTYAKSRSELKDRWRKQLKLSTLSLLTDRLKLQENKSKGIEQTDIDAESKLISGDDLSDNAVATKKILLYQIR